METISYIRRLSDASPSPANLLKGDSIVTFASPSSFINNSRYHDRRTMTSKFLCFVLGAMSSLLAQELPPTEQTSFSYPSNGAGVSLPFPSDLASLTGLSDWPSVWVTPPFTDNMKKLYNPSASATFGDIVAPPGARGSSHLELFLTE